MAKMLDASEAWRRYVSVGAIDHELLRPRIAGSWERCHRLGADARRLRAEILDGNTLERRRDERAGLISAATPYMRILSSAVGSLRHAAMLGDSDAVLMNVIGDRESVEGPDGVPPAGALLSEQTAGANGVGTPIAEGGYVEIVGPEHFIGGFRPFTCHGTPIRGAGGEIAGCLSISVRSPSAAERLRELLQVASRGIHAQLVADHLRRDLDLVVASACRFDEAELIERLHQDVVQAYTAARFDIEESAFAILEGRETLIEEASIAIDRFEQLARAWRLVAGAVPEPREAAAPGHAEQVLEDMIALLGVEAQMHGVALTFVRSEEWAPHWREAARLARPLMHLVLNAMQTAGPGGVVELSAKRELSCTASSLSAPPVQFGISAEARK